MKQWAAKAGLVDKEINNQCKIVYEPDCASLAIQYHMKDASSVQYDVARKKKKRKKKKSDDHDEKENHEEMRNGSETFTAELGMNYDEFQLVKGDKYILVDVGGGIFYIQFLFCFNMNLF